MYQYICMYVCRCVYVNICIYIYIHIRIYMSVCVRLWVCIHICIYLYCWYIYIYMYTYTYIHTHTHTHTYTHTHIHVRSTPTHFWHRRHTHSNAAILGSTFRGHIPIFHIYFPPTWRIRPSRFARNVRADVNSGCWVRAHFSPGKLIEFLEGLFS